MKLFRIIVITLFLAFAGMFQINSAFAEDTSSAQSEEVWEDANESGEISDSVAKAAEAQAAADSKKKKEKDIIKLDELQKPVI